MKLFTRSLAFLASTAVLASAAPATSLFSLRSAIQAIAPADTNDFTNHQLVRIAVPEGSSAKIASILEDELELDVWGVSESGIDVRLAPGVEESVKTLLEANGATLVEVLETNIQETIDAEKERLDQAAARFAPADWHTDYHDYTAIKSWYQGLASTYPDLVTFTPSIGKTVGGRDIFAVRITNKKAPGDKPQFYLESLIHAREWISGATLQYVTDQLLQGYGSDSAVTDLLDKTEFLLVPVVNPDGYAYSWTSNRLWRKNRNGQGVDLNRNFPDHWGQGGSSSSPSSETYRGPSAGSELETKALMSYFLNPSNKRIVGAIDIHSYSQLVLRPYGWTSANSPDETKFKAAGDGIASAIKANSGVSYSSIKSYNLYQTTGSTTDWWYGAEVIGKLKTHIYAFCIELRPGSSSSNGFVLPPSQIIPTGKEIFAALKSWTKYVLANPISG
ncbi:hypothetical protein HDU85_003368 [Gaertneriomyces sp. JEL0708]|nr:hypothetical protein HDU85_003368 [Gaertneriomyces sp. JEL0708]